MATKAQISIDFNKAMAVAKNMRETAKEMKAEAKKFMTTNEKVRADWTGENANEFLTKTMTVNEKLEKAINELNKMADKIEKIAKRTYNAEMAALEAVKTKSTTTTIKVKYCV